jgi:hypothetical protein
MPMHKVSVSTAQVSNLLASSEVHFISCYHHFAQFTLQYYKHDRLCGLVVRVLGYRSRGPGFNSWRYHIF